MERHTYSARELPKYSPFVILYSLLMCSAALQPLSGKLYQYYTSKARIPLSIADIDTKVFVLTWNV